MANPKFTPQSRRFPLNPFAKRSNRKKAEWVDGWGNIPGGPVAWGAPLDDSDDPEWELYCLGCYEQNGPVNPIPWGDEQLNQYAREHGLYGQLTCDSCYGPFYSAEGHEASRKNAEYVPTPLDEANEGLTRCFCGCKYWENDRCIDCGEKVTNIPGYYKASRKTAKKSVMERINEIAASGWGIAYDGCHKIYWCRTEAEREDAEDTGYEIYASSRIGDLLEGSCGLEFAHAWSGDSSDLDIAQGEYAEAMGYTARKTAAPVKFPSKCKVCGADIPKGSGDVRKVDGAWYTTCNDHKPAPKPRYTYRPRTYKMSDGFQTIYVEEDDVYDAKRDGFYIVSLKKQAVIPPWAYPEERELSNYDLETILEGKLQYLPECCGAVDFDFVDGWGTSGMDGVGSMGVVGEITYECGWCHARYELDFDE